jgi:CheY-like chemotaxis protein
LKILLADDEKTIRMTLGDDLEAAGHQVTAVDDGREAADCVEKENFDVLITDIKMPGLTGIELLDRVKQKSSETEVILITGFGTIESAVEAMKLGAYDYILKPFLNEKVVAQVEKIERLMRLTEENVRLREELKDRRGFDDLVGPPQGQAPGHPQLLPVPRDAPGRRIIRPREGSLHRRPRGQGGPLRTGPGGHHLPRRHRRHDPAHAGQTPAHPPGEEVRKAGGRVELP